MKREEIKQILPHREPMLLVDEMELQGDECVAHYTVRGDEFFLQGHFPGMPIVPGVILCEMMGQGSALLLLDYLDGQTVPMFVAMENVRFKHPVHPGDTVESHAKIVNRRANIVFVESSAYVNGNLSCSAHLTVALTKTNKDEIIRK